MQWIETPSVEATGTLMRHPGISLILATGGNAMVKAACSAGKPALGVGAGNVPAYVHRSAELRRAANDLVLSAPRAPEGPIGRDRCPQGGTALPSRPCPLCGHAGPRPLPAGSVFGRRS